MDDRITDQPPPAGGDITDQPPDPEPRGWPDEFRRDPGRCLAKLPSRRTLVGWLWRHSLLGAVAGEAAGWYVSHDFAELPLAMLLGLPLGLLFGCLSGLICGAISRLIPAYSAPVGRAGEFRFGRANFVFGG